MPKSYISASNIGLNSMDTVKDKASRYKMFNAEDWNSFAVRGQLGNYIQMLDEFNKKVDFDAFQKRYGYALDDLSSQSRIVAIMNELEGNRKLKDIDGTHISEYEQTANYLREEIAFNQAERYQKMQTQLAKLQTGWADFENAMRAIPHKLSTSFLKAVGSIERGIKSIGNVVGVASGAMPELIAQSGADPNQDFGAQLSDILDYAYNKPFQDTTWDTEAVGNIDKFFNYQGWEYAQGFAKYTASLSDSIGRMVPSMIMTAVGGGLLKLGPKLAGVGVGLDAISVKTLSVAADVVGTGLAGTAQLSYYLGMQSNNYSEMMENPNLCSRPTFELVANSAIRAAFEFGVEKALKAGFGASALDSIAFGLTQKTSAGVKATSKALTLAGVKRIGIDALHEGLEEVLQDFSGNFTNLLFGYIDQHYAETADWSLQAMFDAFFMGALMSAGGSMMLVMKALVFKNKRNYTNEFVTDKNGNVKLDKNGIPIFKKLNLFANYEYNLTMESFMESFEQFVGEDYDYMTPQEQSDLTAEMMQMFKTITSVFGAFGDERFQKAQNILNTLDEERAHYDTGTEKLRESTFKELADTMLDVASDAQNDAIRKQKPEIIDKLVRNHLSGLGTIVTAKMTDDEIRDLVGEMSLKTARGYLDSGYDYVIFADNGKNIVLFKDVNAVVVPKQLSKNFTPETNMRTSVEQDIAHNMAESKEFVEQTEEIVRHYRSFVGDQNATAEQAFLAMLYNDLFQQVLLYSGDKTLIKLVDSLSAMYEASQAKGLEKTVLQQQIAIIKENIGKILFQYYLDQPGIDKAFINSSKILTADQKRKLINMTWQKNIYHRIFDDPKAMPTAEDLTVLDRQIDNAKYQEDAETWQENVRTLIHSKSHNLVEKGLRLLNAYYKNIYTGRYNGQIYMPYDGSVANATFNAFCFAYGISIPELRTTNGLTTSDIATIRQDYGDVNERTIFQYWNSKFISEYGYSFEEKRSKDVITLTIKEATPVEEQRGAVGRDAYKGMVQKSADTDRVVSNYVIGPSKAMPKGMLSDSINPVERAILTVDDVIKDPSLLSEKVRNEIKAASNGRLDTAAVFLYLRKKYFKDSKGKSTIVLSEDGSSYYVATIDNTPAVLKTDFEKTGFNELVEARNKVSTENPEVELDLRDYVGKKYSKMFELEDGTSVLPRLVVRAFGNTADAGDYDAMTNTIYINSDFSDFTVEDMRFYLAHEFRHAIQYHNGEAVGFDSNWLVGQMAIAKNRNTSAVAKVEAIVADIKAHYPELFARKKNSMSDLELASDILYTLSSGESGAYGYDLDASFYPFVVKVNEYGAVDSIMTPWGNSYSSRGVTYAKQKVTSKATKPTSGVQVDTKKSYSSNEDALGTNLKYYVKQADIEANKAARAKGELPTGETVGMPIKNIVPNVRLRHLIVATTGRESKFDPTFIEEIKSARLRTNSDVINYLHYIDNAKYDSSLESGTKYAQQVNYTLAAIAYYYYDNKYFAQDSSSARAVIEMTSSVDAGLMYATAYTVKNLLEVDDDSDIHNVAKTFWDQSKPWNKTTKLSTLLQKSESNLFNKGLDTLTTKYDAAGEKVTELDIDYSSLAQAMLKGYDGTLQSLYKILNAKRKGAEYRAERMSSIDENVSDVDISDGGKGDKSRMGIDAAQYGLDPENNSMDRIEYVVLSLTAQRIRTDEEWLSTPSNQQKQLRAIESRIASETRNEIEDTWDIDKIDMMYYAITQSNNTEAAIDRIESMDTGTNKVTEYRALRRNILDRTRRYINNILKGMIKAEIAAFVARNPGLGISKDGTFSIPTGYSDAGIASEIVKSMTLRELKQFYKDHIAGIKSKQVAMQQTMLMEKILGKNPTRANYEQVGLAIVADMSPEAMNAFNQEHSAEVTELRKKYANRISKIGSTATVEAAQAATRQAQDFETAVRSAVAEWQTGRDKMTAQERAERNTLIRSNQAKQRKLERYQEQVDTLIAKVKDAQAASREAKANQNVKTVKAEITTGGEIEAPDVIKPMLEPIYNRVRKTYTSVANTDEVHFEQSWNDFLQDFGDDLDKIKMSDVDGILDFVARASIDLEQDTDAVRSFYATRQFLLMYLYKQHYDPDSAFALTEEQLDRVNRMFGTIAGVAGTNLRLSAIADKLISPAAKKLQAQAKKLGIDFAEEDLNELDMIIGHDYTIDVLKKTGATKVTPEIQAEADELKMSKLVELQTRMFEKARKNFKGKKKTWFDKVWEWERMAMLSSPGTWIRNAFSNVMVEQTNKISAFIGEKTIAIVDAIGNLFKKKGQAQVRQATLTDQYNIVNTKPTDDVKTFINEKVYGSGFMDLIGESLAKQDVESFANKTDSAGYIVASMMRRNIISKVLKTNKFEGESKVGKGLATVGNWINDILYGKETEVKNADGTVTVKHTNGMLSDNKWVDRQFKYYLERMLTEDVAAGRINLSKGLNDKAILEVVTNAYIQASWDYMHKSNFFSDVEAKLREKVGPAGYFIYKQFSPFAAASWNWFTKALDYTPIGLVKAITEWSRLEQKIAQTAERRMPSEGKGEILPTERLTAYQIKRRLGSGIIGTIGFGIGALLVAAGTAGIDDDDDKLKLFVGNVSVSLDDVFGTSGMLMGIAMASQIRKSTANQEDFMSTMWKALSASLNTAFDDSIFSDVLDMMQGSRTFVDIMANKAVDTFFGAFVPNLIWTFANYMTPVKTDYSGGLLGYIERSLVKTIPPLAWALPKRRDPYTGQLQYKYNMPWADGAGGFFGSVAAAIANWLLPAKVYNRKVSDAEQIAIGLGVSKGPLTGNYSDIGQLSTIEQDKLNEYYGGLNQTDLNNFIYSNKKYLVENKNGKRVELTYNRMTDEQRTAVIKRIMSENAKYAKIYVATSKGYKYYTRSQTEYDRLKQLGLTNVYLSAKPVVNNFVK